MHSNGGFTAAEVHPPSNALDHKLYYRSLQGLDKLQHGHRCTLTQLILELGKTQSAQGEVPIETCC